MSRSRAVGRQREVNSPGCRSDDTNTATDTHVGSVGGVKYGVVDGSVGVGWVGWGEVRWLGGMR